MKFITSAAIKEALKQIKPKNIAVAYVGVDWKNYIEPSLLKDIILSPTIGTNPYAVVDIVDHIGWENVYFLDNLHAKVYLGASDAALGSFNLTFNGLSSEGLEEAGVLVKTPKIIEEIRSLLEEYKSQARKLYPSKEAKILRLSELRSTWDRGVNNGVIRNDVSRRDFSEYQPVASDEIYVSCVWGELEYNEKIVSVTTVGNALSFLEDDNLLADRWMLCWRARRDGFPDSRCDPYWLHIDEVLSKGAIHEKYTKLVIERGNRRVMHPPFELTKPFVKAFYAILNSSDFPDFLSDRDPWSINPTLPQLPKFFSALRDEWKRQHATPSSRQTLNLTSLRKKFSERILEAMDISIRKKYVTYSIDGMLARSHAVEVAKQLVRPSLEMKSGLRKLSKAEALHLSFESIMLEKQFEPLFSKSDLECARFNLLEVNPKYRPPVG